jgi:hypothetical protein
METGEQPATSVHGAAVVGGHFDPKTGPGPYVMAADTLMADPIRNRAGEKLGDIKAIMIDVPGGRVAYAVLAVGGVLGVGERLFAIPWNALTLDADNKCFMLDATKEHLRNAPGFDKDRWPAMADPAWGEQVHTYYGTRPYWRAGTTQP